MTRLWFSLAWIFTVFVSWRIYFAYRTQQLGAAGQGEEALLAVLGSDPFWRVVLRMGNFRWPLTLLSLNLIGIAFWSIVTLAFWLTYVRSQRS
jgi:hypothetical protein